MTPTFALLSAGALTWAFLEERPGYPRLFGYLAIVLGLCILISVGARVYLVSPSEIALQTFYQGVLMSGVAIMTFNRAIAMLAPPRRRRSWRLFPCQLPCWPSLFSA
jgi:predicted acyltransferase